MQELEPTSLSLSNSTLKKKKKTIKITNENGLYLFHLTPRSRKQIIFVSFDPLKYMLVLEISRLLLNCLIGESRSRPNEIQISWDSQLCNLVLVVAHVLNSQQSIEVSRPNCMRLDASFSMWYWSAYICASCQLNMTQVQVVMYWARYTGSVEQKICLKYVYFVSKVSVV